MANSGVLNFVSGMYVLTAREDGRDYGCLVNTAMEVSRNPGRIAVCLVKRNLTCEVLQRTGIFNLCALTEDAPYEIFHRFGMTSSRKVGMFLWAQYCPRPLLALVLLCCIPMIFLW